MASQFKFAPTSPAPTTPTNLVATAVSSSQINLTWTASTDDIGVTQYLIERCTGASCSGFVQVATSAMPSYPDTGLAASTFYRYRVRATDIDGNLSGYSTIATAATQMVSDTTPPSTPLSLVATVISSSQIDLTWAASSDNVGVTSYRLERCQGASCSGFVQIDTPTGTSYSDSGLTASTLYRYRVRAADAAGNLSGYSAVAETTTFAVGAYAAKLSASGVVSGISFDSTANVFAPGLSLPTQPMTYAWFPGACDVANPGGAGNGTLTLARASTERLCLALEQDGVCYFPQIDNTIYHSAGGGAGALKLTIPSKSTSGTGGYAWIPFKGLGSSFDIGPDHANGGIVYVQYFQRWSQSVITSLIPLAGVATGFNGMKQPWFFGNPPNGDDSSYFEVTPALRFAGGLFTMSGQQGADPYETASGPTIYLQNAALCAYQGPPNGDYGDYPVPPCLVVEGDRWYEFTFALQLRPVASDFVVSGSTLSRASTFDATLVGKDVFIVGDGFHNISGFINANSVTLAGSPIAGSGKSVYIANYANSRMRSWVDGAPCIDYPYAKVWWGTNGSGDGFGAMKFQAHMTSKDSTVVHAPATMWVDDVVISSQPITMTGPTALEQLAASMSSGQWAALPTLNMADAFLGTGGSSNMANPFAINGVWDPVRKKMHGLWGDHCPPPIQANRHIQYDAPTNTWSWGLPPFPESHGYHLTALNPTARKLVRNPYSGSNIFKFFNLDADDTTNPANWTETTAPIGTYIINAIEYFPERNSIIWQVAAGAFEYSFTTGLFTDITPSPLPGWESTWTWNVYNPVLKEMLCGSVTNKLWTYSQTGVWAQKTDIPVTYRTKDESGFNGVWVADPVSGKYLILTDPTNGTGRNFYEYNSVTDSYAVASPQIPDKKLNGNFCVIPIPESGVTMWVWAVGFSGGTCGVYLYKH